MPLIVCASCNKVSWENVQRKFEERRQVLENARNTNLRRLRQDVDRIAKREAEFVQKVVETIVPVRVSWNDDAWKKLQEFVPIRVEVDKKEGVVETVVPTVVDESNTPAKLD